MRDLQQLHTPVPSARGPRASADEARAGNAVGRCILRLRPHGFKGRQDQGKPASRQNRAPQGSAEKLAAIRGESGVGAADGRVPRLMPGDSAKASKARFHAEARFYMHVDVAFFERTKTPPKDELGVRSMIVGSADHNVDVR